MTVQRLESSLSALLDRIGDQGRRQLARELARQLRQNQQKRIAAQLNPDGSAFAPRKPQVRARKGKLRRTMFVKLRTTKWLQTEASPNAAVIGFVGRVGRLAAVHQYGLRDRAQPGGPEVKYPARQLLGLSDTDVAAIRDAVIVHLAG